MRRCPGGGLELAIGDAGVSVGRAGIVLGAHPPVPQAGWVVKRRGGCGAGPRGMGGLGCAMPTGSRALNFNATCTTPLGLQYRGVMCLWPSVSWGVPLARPPPGIGGGWGGRPWGPMLWAARPGAFGPLVASWPTQLGVYLLVLRVHRPVSSLAEAGPGGAVLACGRRGPLGSHSFHAHVYAVVVYL